MSLRSWSRTFNLLPSAQQASRKVSETFCFCTFDLRFDGSTKRLVPEHEVRARMPLPIGQDNGTNGFHPNLSAVRIIFCPLGNVSQIYRSFLFLRHSCLLYNI